MGNTFFRYPGGKTKLRKPIMQKLHNMIPSSKFEYREPFYGGGSIGLDFISDLVSLFRNDVYVWLNDKDIGVACLWTSVMSYLNELERLIESFEPSVEAFYKFKKELLDVQMMPINPQDIVDIGFKKIVIHQISYSGLGTKSGGPLGGQEQKSRYGVGCRWSPAYICKKIKMANNILTQCHIRSNICTALDFTDLIMSNVFPAIIYVDPPYFKKGKDLYQHSFTLVDHERLAKTLKDTEHKWVLSYDDCEEIRDLYSWANIEVIEEVNYSITAIKTQEGKRMSRTKNELLITSLR